MALISSEDVKKLFHPFYVVNLILALSYIISKFFQPICMILHTTTGCEIDFRESEILTFLVIVVVFRTRKYGTTSMLPYLSSACMYAKMANVLLFFYSDPRMGIIYLVVCLLQVVLLPEPTYSGPNTIMYFRGSDFDDEVQRDKRIAWLVAFYAAWNPNCVSFAPLFAELSAKYGLENLRFGKVDVGRFPEIAAKYQLSTSSFGKQLPSIILFKSGKEVARRPACESNGKLIKFFFTKENIINAFDLNNLYEECKKNPLKRHKKHDPHVEDHVKSE